MTYPFLLFPGCSPPCFLVSCDRICFSAATVQDRLKGISLEGEAEVDEAESAEAQMLRLLRAQVVSQTAISLIPFAPHPILPSPKEAIASDARVTNIVRQRTTVWVRSKVTGWLWQHLEIMQAAALGYYRSSEYAVPLLFFCL